jgi:general secretion pathway protein B
VAPAPLLTPIPDLQPIPPAPKPAAEPRGTVRISPVELDQSPLEEGVIEASQPGSGQPASEPQADLAAQERLPVWPQIPTALFAQLPDSLKLDVHVYANLPAERFVLVNLQKYREGETLREGPVLEEITPQGVILSFRGQRFELLAK